MQILCRFCRTRMNPAFTVLVWITMSSLIAAAQITSGRIVGSVVDPSSAAIPGAMLTLTSGASGSKLVVNSGSAGDYVFEAVDPGNYSLVVEAPGFQRFLLEGIQVHIQTTETINAKMQAGQVQQTVTVTASAPLLQAQDGSLGQTIGNEQVNNMPLQSRDWTTLGMLAPGTVTTGGANQANYSVMGINSGQNDFRLNGIDNNEEIYGGGHIQGLSNNDGAAFVPPPDAIEEFKLQSGNFSAEVGHSTGGVINASIRSGTNGIHGALWEYVRNTDFNANDYFAKQAGIPRSAYHQNQFGGTVGGPVIIPKLYDGRNKTFFLFDYQGTRLSTPSQITAAVPSDNIRSSGYSNLQDLITVFSGGAMAPSDALGRKFLIGTVFDPSTTRSVGTGAVDPVTGLTNTSGSQAYIRDPFYSNGSIAGIRDFTGLTQYLNQLPSQRIDPNAVKILNLYPSANHAYAAGYNYLRYAANTITINSYDARIDEHVSQKDFIFGVFDVNNEITYTPPTFPGYAEGQVYADGQTRGPRYAIAVGYTHIFSPKLTNEAHAGWTHSLEEIEGPNGSVLGIPTQFGIGGVPQVPGNGGLPPINIGGFHGIGTSGYMPTNQTITALEILDNVTKLTGRHTLKAGFQIDKLYASIIQPPYGRGRFGFTGAFTDLINNTSGATGIADMLLVPTAAPGLSGAQLGGLDYFNISKFAQVRDRRYYAAIYFQDDWRVSSKLTLNLGLRWDHYTPYAEIDGNQANFAQDGGGSGNAGTFYLAAKQCKTPLSATFQAMLSTSNISVLCANNAVGHAQDLNLAPRIGFAYSITPRAVIRGGYGITYGALDNVGFGNNLGNNYPFGYTVSPYAQTAYSPLILANGQTATLEDALTSQNFQDPTTVTPEGVTLLGRDFNIHTPYQQTTNLMIQDQFTKHDAFTVGYAATFGNHLDSFGTNNSTTAILPPGSNIYSTSVPGHIAFPQFQANGPTQIYASNSNYNSFQAIYQHDLSHGLSMLANYTLSKCLSDQHSGGYRAEWLPGFGVAADYGPCDAVDTRHVVKLNGVYHLPFGRNRGFLDNVSQFTDSFIGGWTFDFIYIHQSGQPDNVGCAYSTTANYGCNANLVTDGQLYGGNISHWIFPTAFATPNVATVAGQQGFSPLGSKPNQFRDPAYGDLSAALTKDFDIHDTWKLNFRVDAFNLPNTPHFSGPNTNLNSSSFGEIGSMRGNPRILQLALKLFY